MNNLRDSTRAHFYTGASLYVRLAERTARTAECPGCFASLRSEQGAAPLALLMQLSSALCSGGNLLSADTPAAKSEIRKVQGTLHPGQGVGTCGSETHSDGTQVC